MSAALDLEPYSDKEAIQFDREYVRRKGLWGFLQIAWHLIEPAHALVEGWHLEEICNHCQAMSEGRWQRGVINVPPGHAKSSVVSVAWQPYAWIDQPELRFMFTSYDDGLANRDAGRAKAIICSEWYQQRWPHVQIVGGQRAADHSYSNSATGYRISASVQGGITGKHADIQVCDDPHKALDVQSKSGANLAKVEAWWSGTMASRHRDPNSGRRLVIMQRLHENDLSGVCLADGYENLCLPVHYDPERASKTSIGGDRRTRKDELLFPQRLPEETIKRLMHELGDHARAQYEQDPSHDGGGPIKQEHFRYWKTYPEQFDWLVWSWDCAFKDTESSDYVCGQLWGKQGPNYWLMWRVYEKLDFSSTLNVIEEMNQWSVRQFGQRDELIVEDKANGPAVINTLQKKIAGLVAVNPLGSKVGRAQACAYLFRGGNVFFPDPTVPGYEWSKDHALTVRRFPRVKNDDTVDAMTQLLLYGEQRDGNMVEALRAFLRVGVAS